MSRQPKWQAKYIAARRAQYALQAKLDKIDWEYDVLDGDVDQMQLEAARTDTIPEITVGNADSSK